jgi:hypothetical protein
MAKVKDGMKPPLMIPVRENRVLKPTPKVPRQQTQPTPAPAQPVQTDTN